jgi:hypothetical protein
MYHYDHYKVEKVCRARDCSVKHNRRSEMRHHERIAHGIIEYDYDGPQQNEVHFMRMYMDVKSGREDDYPNCTGPYKLDTEDFVDADAIVDSVNKDPFREHRTESKIPEERILKSHELIRIKV